MAYLYRCLCVLVLLFCAQLAAADNATTLTDASKTIMVAKNSPQFSVSLPANPSTGYSWFMEKYDPRFVEVVNHVHQPQSQVPGASGIDVWTFKLTPITFTAPHVLRINLLYARAWDVNTNPRMASFTVITH